MPTLSTSTITTLIIHIYALWYLFIRRLPPLLFLINPQTIAPKTFVCTKVCTFIYRQYVAGPTGKLKTQRFESVYLDLFGHCIIIIQMIGRALMDSISIDPLTTCDPRCQCSLRPLQLDHLLAIQCVRFNWCTSQLVPIVANCASEAVHAPLALCKCSFVMDCIVIIFLSTIVWVSACLRTKPTWNSKLTFVWFWLSTFLQLHSSPTVLHWFLYLSIDSQSILLYSLRTQRPRQTWAQTRHSMKLPNRATSTSLKNSVPERWPARAWRLSGWRVR